MRSYRPIEDEADDEAKCVPTLLSVRKGIVKINPKFIESWSKLSKLPAFLANQQKPEDVQLKMYYVHELHNRLICGFEIDKNSLEDLYRLIGGTFSDCLVEILKKFSAKPPDFDGISQSYCNVITTTDNQNLKTLCVLLLADLMERGKTSQPVQAQLYDDLYKKLEIPKSADQSPNYSVFDLYRWTAKQGCVTGSWLVARGIARRDTEAVQADFEDKRSYEYSVRTSTAESAKDLARNLLEAIGQYPFARLELTKMYDGKIERGTTESLYKCAVDLGSTDALCCVADLYQRQLDALEREVNALNFINFSTERCLFEKDMLAYYIRGIRAGDVRSILNFANFIGRLQVHATVEATHKISEVMGILGLPPATSKETGNRNPEKLIFLGDIYLGFYSKGDVAALLRRARRRDLEKLEERSQNLARLYEYLIVKYQEKSALVDLATLISHRRIEIDFIKCPLTELDDFECFLKEHVVLCDTVGVVMVVKWILRALIPIFLTNPYDAIPKRVRNFAIMHKECLVEELKKFTRDQWQIDFSVPLNRVVDHEFALAVILDSTQSHFFPDKVELPGVTDSSKDVLRHFGFLETVPVFLRRIERVKVNEIPGLLGWAMQLVTGQAQAALDPDPKPDIKKINCLVELHPTIFAHKLVLPCFIKLLVEKFSDAGSKEDIPESLFKFAINYKKMFVDCLIIRMRFKNQSTISIPCAAVVDEHRGVGRFFAGGQTNSRKRVDLFLNPPDSTPTPNPERKELGGDDDTSVFGAYKDACL